MGRAASGTFSRMDPRHLVKGVGGTRARVSNRFRQHSTAPSTSVHLR